MILQDVRRIKWQQKWLPRYFYQHIYIPMLYCVVSLSIVNVCCEGWMYTLIRIKF